MSRLLRILVLILLPINAWLAVFYYLHYQKQKALSNILQQFDQERRMVYKHIQENLGIKIGQPLYIPYPVTVIGNRPPIGQGVPILFVNISWITSYEVWEPTLSYALNISPYLYVVLLHCPEAIKGKSTKPLTQMISKFNNPRLSALVGDWICQVFGGEVSGTLFILCDGKGIVREVEPYPELKLFAYWSEEVADWRPKLHQAVKKVLDKFFPKGKER